MEQCGSAGLLADAFGPGQRLLGDSPEDSVSAFGTPSSPTGGSSDGPAILSKDGRFVARLVSREEAGTMRSVLEELHAEQRESALVPVCFILPWTNELSVRHNQATALLSWVVMPAVQSPVAGTERFELPSGLRKARKTLGGLRVDDLGDGPLESVEAWPGPRDTEGGGVGVALDRVRQILRNDLELLARLGSEGYALTLAVYRASEGDSRRGGRYAPEFEPLLDVPVEPCRSERWKGHRARAMLSIDGYGKRSIGSSKGNYPSLVAARVYMSRVLRGVDGDQSIFDSTC
jgi:hypothetical protein